MINKLKTTHKVLCSLTLAGAALLTAHPARAATDADKKFLAMAAQSDVNEIKLSELAQQKATNPAVKAFADKMVTEHKELSESMKPFAEQWGLTPPADLDEAHKKEYAKLNGLSGKAFDKEYIDQMVTDHTKALSAFTKEANDTQDGQFKAAVVEAKSKIAAHKNMAYDLKKKL